MFLDNNLKCCPEGDPQVKFYFSKRSRDQLKAQVLMYHQTQILSEFALNSV
jgi:hypothetical protein